jgi:large-conductance mechanosensitive channel
MRRGEETIGEEVKCFGGEEQQFFKHSELSSLSSHVENIKFVVVVDNVFIIEFSHFCFVKNKRSRSKRKKKKTKVNNSKNKKYIKQEIRRGYVCIYIMPSSLSSQ